MAVPAIANFTPEDVRNQNQILLCFTLGLTQLMIAHVVSLFRNIKSPKFLADVGSLSMLGGMYFVVLNLVVDSQKYAINNTVLLAIGAGFALNFIFVNYSTGIGQAIVESLKNIINMLLGKRICRYYELHKTLGCRSCRRRYKCNRKRDGRPCLRRFYNLCRCLTFIVRTRS